MLVRALEPSTRARALLEKARLLALERAPAGAVIASLDAVLALAPADGGAPDALVPWLLAAQFRKAVQRIDAGDTGTGAAELLDFIDDVINGRGRAGAFAGFYVGEALSRLEALASAGALDAPLTARLDQVRKSHRRRESEAAFRRGLEEEWLPRLRAAARSGAGGPRRLARGSGASLELLVWESRAGDPDRVAGFRVRLESLAGWLLERSGRAVDAVDPLPWIEDAGGRRVAGPAAEEATASGERVEVPLAGDLPWRLVLPVGAELRAFRARRALLYGGAGAAAFALAALAALTTLRGLYREVELAELRGQFVANVSHELKTPLAIIRMFTDLLLLGYSRDPAEIEANLKVIARETENLDLLIENVLELSRIDAGEKSYHPAPEDLGELARRTVEGFRPFLERKGFTARVEAEEALPPVFVDRAAFVQALRNLLSNAVKYSEAIKEIDVGIRRAGGTVEVEVADRGIGIAPGQRGRIFERFYRGRAGERAAVSGTGLGLSIVAHAARAHGGSVRAAGREGGGAAVTMVFPVLEAEAPRRD
jgi:signal transduction histidine kinase